MIDVYLSHPDMEWGMAIARQRMANAAADDRKSLFEREISADRTGAMAEVAVAIALGKLDEWIPNVQPDKDVGDVFGWEVKGTDRFNGQLIAKLDTRPEAKMVLVVGAPPWLRIVGWSWGREAKQMHFWRPDVPKPCYMVPQRHLMRWEPGTGQEELELPDPPRRAVKATCQCGRVYQRGRPEWTTCLRCTVAA